jgi:hypothetical protein
MPVSQPIAAHPKIVGIASGRPRQVALGLLGAGLLLSLFGGDLAGLSFFLFFPALGMLFQSSFLLRWGLAFIGSLLLLLLGGIPRSVKRNRETEQARAEVNGKAAIEKAAREAEKTGQDERDRAEQRRRMPETYEKAVDLARAGKYSEAATLLEEIAKLDADYKDVRLKLKSVRGNVVAGQAALLLKEANRLSKSHNCGEMRHAESNLVEVAHIDPGKAATLSPSLLNVRERMLACYQGDTQIEMAINIISKRRPVVLNVHIKNVSGKVRHANPNNFTLITKSGTSHSYSSETFGYPTPFSAVQLQPQTETSGVVVFASDAPRTLIYQDLGTRISRDFP